MEFHIITSHGALHLFSVEGGRIISPIPELGQPLPTCGAGANPVTTARADLQDHSAYNAEIDASLV